MSWLWPDFVNRDLPLTRQERKAIHRDAWKLWMANKWNIVLYLTLPTFYLLSVPFVGDLAGRMGSLVDAGGFIIKLLRAGAPFALFVMCFVAGGAILQRSRFAPCVYRALRDHGHDVCLKCGYWLRGLPAESDRCPECGKERKTMAGWPGC